MAETSFLDGREGLCQDPKALGKQEGDGHGQEERQTYTVSVVQGPVGGQITYLSLKVALEKS